MDVQPSTSYESNIVAATRTWVTQSRRLIPATTCCQIQRALVVYLLLACHTTTTLAKAQSWHSAGKLIEPERQQGEGKDCYSCMSEHYKYHWESAGYNRIYLEPHVFTDYCADPSKAPLQERDRMLQPCQLYQNCMTLSEDLSFGMLDTKAYIRGCFSKILRHSFNKKHINVSRLEYTQQCNDLSSKTLMTDGGLLRPTTFRVCGCMDHECNGGAVGRSYNIRPAFAALILPLLIVLLIRM